MNRKSTGIDQEWWKSAVFYQILPASFRDSNGDGYGDLRGITMKLDYLSWLGIGAIWLSPVFESPFTDMGYDVSDYRKVNPLFGSLDDLKDLLDMAHSRKIRVILDMVMNHTSIRHPWFQESRSSRDNPKRDWYLWRDGSDGGKPNNWKSLFGGSAWTLDRATGQYYYHTFLREQPDLNWRNAEVRQQFYSIIRYWLDMGFDGFRLDAINVIIKDSEYRDASPPFVFQLLGRENHVTRNQPESYNILQELREVVDHYEDRLLVGEIYTLPPGNPGLVASYLSGKPERLDLAFDFSLIFSRWSARKYHNAILKGLKSIPPEGWPCHVLSNHDLNRSLGSGWFTKHSDGQAKVMAALILTLKGTPFLYYGEEIGMRNSSIPLAKRVDPLGQKFWPFYTGRDSSRTPMHWDSGIHAGFSTVEPWLPVDPGFQNRNVMDQLGDRSGILWFYRELISLRKTSPALLFGNWTSVIRCEKNVLAYLRTSPGQMILVVLNFSASFRRIRVNLFPGGNILLSTHRRTHEQIRLICLKLFPFESTLILVDEDHGFSDQDLPLSEA